MLGDINSYNETDTTKWDSNFTIADSVIRNMPVEYTGATGLFAAYVQGATIEHNHCKAATNSRVQFPLGRSAASKRQGAAANLCLVIRPCFSDSIETAESSCACIVLCFAVANTSYSGMTIGWVRTYGMWRTFCHEHNSDPCFRSS